MQVELVYEQTCPNIEAARKQLLKAFVKADLSPHWQEWEVSSADAPEHIHGYGSPTILVNGQDVSGDIDQGNDYCCRVYNHDEQSNKGIPALTDIIQALNVAHGKDTSTNTGFRWRLNSAILPAIGVALLPKLFCPACWPAYAGLLSTLGIGFVDYTPYLLPLTLVFLMIAIAALTYRAKNRHGYKPLLVGLLASSILIVGKFHYDSDIGMYIGLSFLILASLWNTWPVSGKENQNCTACNNFKEAQPEKA